MRKIIYILFVFFYHIAFAVACFSLFTFCLLAQSITWQRTYGGPEWDEGHSIVQTPDSGYIAVGLKYISPSEYMYVLRLNKYGDVIWDRIYPFGRAWEIERTSDNNYIIMSAHSLLKININGDTLWSKRQFDIDTVYSSINETADSGFIISGFIFGGIANTFPYLLKVNSVGVTIWEKIYTNNIADGAFTELTISNDNKFVVTGNITDSSFTGNDKLTITKIDTNGNIIWLQKYDTLQYNIAKSICKSNDGGYIIGGGGGVTSISKFNSLGTIQWLKRYDLNFNSTCYSVINTFDGNFVYTGFWDTNATLNFYVRLRKVDNNGNEIWRKSFGFSGDEFARKVRQTNDSGFIIMAFTDYWNTNDDLFIIKTDKNGNAAPYIGIQPSSNIIPGSYEFHPNYPNPFNSQTRLKFDIPYESKVKIIVYNVLGQEILTLINKNLKAGTYRVSLDAKNMTSGIYFARMIAVSPTISYSKTQKLILVK